jgi:hypothetical protein
MNAKPAVFIFLGICLVLAVLLLLHDITPVVSGAIFAVALVLLGGLSKGFRRKPKNQ